MTASHPKVLPIRPATLPKAETIGKMVGLDNLSLKGKGEEKEGKETHQSTPSLS